MHTIQWMNMRIFQAITALSHDKYRIHWYAGANTSLVMHACMYFVHARCARIEPHACVVPCLSAAIRQRLSLEMTRVRDVQYVMPPPPSLGSGYALMHAPPVVHAPQLYLTNAPVQPFLGDDACREVASDHHHHWAAHAVAWSLHLQEAECI